VGQENNGLILSGFLGVLLCASRTIVNLLVWILSLLFPSHRITVDGPAHTHRRTRFDLFYLVFIPPVIEALAVAGKSLRGRGGGLATAFKGEIERRNQRRVREEGERSGQEAYIYTHVII
jgi:hypothetical protein